jgi:hypothetical protein
MKGPRIITIVCHGGNHFDVHEGEAYADRLCWDEMLGQIASMTHPAINNARYQMQTPEQLEQKRACWRELSKDPTEIPPLP